MNNHSLIIENREKVRVSSVNKAERFSEREVLIYTAGGDLLIKGESLDVESFCEMGGDAVICGRINSVAYVSENYHIPDNFWGRLFR